MTAQVIRRPPDRTPVAVFTRAAVGLFLLVAGNTLGIVEPTTATIVAAAVGFVLPLAHPAGYRAVGVVPVGFTSLLAGAIAHVASGPSIASASLTGGGFGLVFGGTVRFLAYWRRRVSSWFSPVVAGFGALMVLNAFFFRGFFATEADDDRLTSLSGPLAFFFFAVAGTVISWATLFRFFFELCVEALVRGGYRLRVRGPGVDATPYRGPLLVIANHACWWDPLFLAGMIPRPVTPMMTAAFFDIWFLRPLMRYVFRTIRVQEVKLRKGTPEVAEAVAALDAGHCVVIFPEGFLRRKEEVPLKRFGRGVWEILAARPDTPVVACWIEGAWGSWTSYQGGPPTTNKKPDVRRPIGIGVSAPIAVPAELLGQHLRTRVFLMNEVLAARAHLGLPPLPAVELPTKDDEPA